MRKVFLIAGLMTAFVLATLASSAATNFAGSYVLDKTKSQGLSPRMAGADKVTWTITQDDKTAYNLDGSETTMEMGQGKMMLKATWAGAVLELSRKTSFTAPDGTERTSATAQKLSLSGDGKVLTAVVHSEGGRGGPTDSTLVFNKQ